MENTNTQLLKQANAAIINGDNEGFLSFCSEAIEWNFVGSDNLKGKEAVRRYMAENYKQPPKFSVERLVADDDHVIAIGTIDAIDQQGNSIPHSYCDVWHVSSGKLDKLDAYVIKI